MASPVGKKAEAVFSDILLGKYIVEARKQDWCFEKSSVSFEILEKTTQIRVKQSGFKVTLTSSHDTMVAQTGVKGDKKPTTVSVSSAKPTEICVKSPGKYSFTAVDSCYKFEQGGLN